MNIILLLLLLVAVAWGIRNSLQNDDLRFQVFTLEAELKAREEAPPTP